MRIESLSLTEGNAGHRPGASAKLPNHQRLLTPEGFMGHPFDIKSPSWHFTIMIKTQVQIPDDLFRRAKAVAAEREWSFAEVVRRGLEYITAVNPSGRTPGSEWKLPPPEDLGCFLAPEEQWTELSHDQP